MSEEKSMQTGDQNIENSKTDKNTENLETPQTEAVSETVEEGAAASAAEVKPEVDVPQEETKVEEQPVVEAKEEVSADTEVTPTENVEEVSTPKVESEDSVSASEESEEVDAEEDHDHDDEEDHQVIDYSNHTREQLAEVIEELNSETNFKKIDAILAQIEPLFQETEDAARQEALDKFIADGGEEADFEYRHDKLYNRFDASLRLIKDKKHNYYKEREATKEKNYQKKTELLDKLRELVDEEATTSLNPIKEIQEEWKKVGQVPNQHNRTLWANYNALIDRFYNNRHILFELKELDRKKNQEAKTELCVKAEALDQMDNLKEAIIQLNELHEEYKNIGPVPKEVQEELWQRFKAASDKVYHKRKEYLDSLKGELNENLEKKKVLAAELKTFTEFDSDRINKWNAKTKEILALQKKWDAIGGLPREHAKEVNKLFWTDFKKFFSNKNDFFKKLEGMRQENLEKKEALIQKAIELQESTDWDSTANKLKALQQQWRDIGPVPEKVRNSIYERFKAACDAFFNNRRANLSKADAEYAENLKKKEAIIQSILDAAAKGTGSEKEMDEFLAQWQAIGFVPRGAMKSIEQKYSEALAKYVKGLDVEGQEEEQLMIKVELGGLQNGPNADRKLNKKEGDLRRQIQEIENNIALWNNNLSFFANSKTADKLKAEFDEKIEKAKEEMDHLKKQLRMVRSM
ncbi:DUF349 domain-containing protein [Roseivirga seohaensis]|uniref:DUF349 domain-containing protein n=1 Tax=Roseivirga seohaensis TaxID=1914963 RepID=UPI000A8C23F6|nr:DUF349 domain-containing protein [Roseivirga seohaensis]